MPQKRPQRQMVNMRVLETSGVDHPAHGFEGWLVKKSVGSQGLGSRLETLLRKEGGAMPNTKLTKEALISEIRGSKASDEIKEALVKSVDLSPDVDAAAALWRSLRDKAEADDPETPSGQEAATEPVAAAGTPAVAAAGADLFKSVTDPVLRKALEDQAAENESLRKSLDETMEKAEVERVTRVNAETVAFIKSTFPHVSIDAEEVGPALRKMREENPEAAAIFEASLEKANGQLEAANMFGELGHSQPANTTSAMTKANTIADGFVAAGVVKTRAEGVTKALSENPSLYAEYEKENR